MRKYLKGKTSVTKQEEKEKDNPEKLQLLTEYNTKYTLMQRKAQSGEKMLEVDEKI